MSGTQRTSLNRTWLLKMGVFFVVLVGFGTWGLVDGLHFYPARGEADASFKLLAYLKKAAAAGRMNEVKVENPKDELKSLSGRVGELKKVAGSSASVTSSLQQAEYELARYEWLDSLSRVWRLESAPSRIEADPRAQMAALEEELKAKNQPTPLERFDLAFQWLFVGVGYIGGVWMLVVLARARAQVYTWAAEEQRLTLPSGASFVPADIREFDKRKWHKFYITLNMNDGKSHELDLLRHVPLEQWVLEMERTRFPETAAESEKPGAEGEKGEDGTPAATPAPETGS